MNRYFWLCIHAPLPSSSGRKDATRVATSHRSHRRNQKMANLLGGKYIHNAIVVEDLPSLPDQIYGDNWPAVVTGKEILSLKFPNTIARGRVRVLYEEPRASVGMQHVDMYHQYCYIAYYPLSKRPVIYPLTNENLLQSSAVQYVFLEQRCPRGYGLVIPDTSL